MDANLTHKMFVPLLLAVVLTACGGGGGGGGTPNIGGAPPPASADVKAFGAVTGIGPGVVVNGVDYDTSGATFTIDGAAGSLGDLGLGDVVVVEGTLGASGVTGTATSVTFRDSVDGPIFGIDRTGGLLLILGQMVKVNAETSFGDTVPMNSLDGLNVGDTVEVSGFEKAATTEIAATRVELKSGGGEFEVTGVVSNLDTVNLRFMINGLVVDYSGATLRDFGAGSISDGDRVEAKGNTLGGAGELIATSVEFEGGVINGNQGDRLEIEGFITRFASSTDFDVATQPVTTNAQTVFEGGVAADLGLNVKVEVEGDIDANGVLVATKVDIRRAKAVRITADVDSVDSANDRLVLLGIDVEVDELTRVEDKSSADVEPLTLADINAGDYLEVRGSEDPNSTADVVAVIVEREDPDTEAILQGFVVSVTEPSLEILGVTIETNGATVFRDVNDAPLTSMQFFAQLVAGDLVKAKGIESSATVITASEVEFELEQ